MELLLGLITGVLFGVLLQKAQVLRFEKQVGFLMFKDMTILKFMFSAILVGMVGITLLHGQGVIELKLKGTLIGAQIIGGLLFGIGWAILGYCPGTSVGALAEGRWHALPGIVGMLLGAAFFAEIYPALKRTVLTWGDLGKKTLPEVLHVNPWTVVAVFVIGILGLFVVLEKAGKKSPPNE